MMMISKEEFPFLWTGTVDTLLGDSVSEDLARTFLLQDDSSGLLPEPVESLAGIAITGRILLRTHLLILSAPPLRPEDVDFERLGGTLRATIRLRTSPSTWAFFAVAVGILLLKGDWSFATLCCAAPFARPFLILEAWKWRMRRGAEELETLLAEGDPPRSDEAPSASTPFARESRRTESSTRDTSLLEVDDSGRWPDPDLAAHLELLAKSRPARVILAEWDGENDPDLQDCTEQEELESRILKDAEPARLRLDSLLGPSTSVAPPREGPGSEELFRYEWNEGNRLLELVLRSQDDGLFHLVLENHTNRIRL